MRVLIVANLALGFYYVGWRYAYTINWAVWPLALALLAAETYSYLGAWQFGMTIWRMKRRGEPPPPPPDATVDVFITCYNEPVELVRETVRAAVAIRFPHNTYILDDGSSAAMRAMTQEEGAGYIVRSVDWKGRPRHAKAGNLNNALTQTQGEFLLILDADQIPYPQILDRTLGYFRDPKVCFVQTPQWFYNVPPSDPFGSQAPLFYGPIQQGKDGWNAAFFCGSNAVVRRETLMQMGIAYYVRELQERVNRALRTADRVLSNAQRQLGEEAAHIRAAISELRVAVRLARRDIRRGEPIQEVTWRFQRKAEAVSLLLVSEDLGRIRAELLEIPGVDVSDLRIGLYDTLEDAEALERLASREASPLAAIETVRNLLLSVDVDRSQEAQPVMPMATISVTEDFATAMRMHALGWSSVYHHEVLARGLAPEDLRSALQQRLRWAQGTIQVMFCQNPLLVRGLTLGQRLMYFNTMYSYLSGFFAVVYLVAPVLYLFFGLLPVRAYSSDFFWHLIPYLVVNQLMFIVVGWGLPTWRGQQYSLALFPLWIQSVTSAAANVFLGKKLTFVVTPKTRQRGVHVGLVRWQLIAMGLLAAAMVWGLARMALGYEREWLPVLVNVFWGCYSLLALSVVLDALAYRPVEAAPSDPNTTSAEVRGRAAAGR
ncbi:MAG: glycosyltransferase [Chloroflexota bacterium]|nr:glycosyltransferase [Chloroflexota bacterium]